MIVGIIIVGCLVLQWAISKNLRDQGVEPLSRGQLRYMRKKARGQGVDVSQVSYTPRKGTNPFPKTAADKETQKILRELERARSGKPPRAPRGRK